MSCVTCALSVTKLASPSTTSPHIWCRVSKVVEDVQELVTALEDPGRVKAAITHTKRKPRVVFVFCGMGTSWPGMCLSLSRDLPVFREKLEEIDRLLSSHVTWSLLNRLEDQNAVKDPEFSPIAIFACQVSSLSALVSAFWVAQGRQLYRRIKCVKYFDLVYFHFFFILLIKCLHSKHLVFSCN